MTAVIQQVVSKALDSLVYGDAPLSQLMIEPALVEQESSIKLDFSVPITSLAEEIATQLNQELNQEGRHISAIEIGHRVPEASTSEHGNSIKGVKNIIAVASGKGGVGKSTTAVNIALALSNEGANVGILDADIYGPSLPAMLGVDGERPDIKDGKRIVPIEAHGLQMISMGNLVNENTPMVWRGPMASGALQQLLMNTEWDSVDYLVIDMPPGTGDIQLTLSQKVPVTGSVIVTTPQDIALLDAKKGIEMFNKVNVPVLGVVENMAVHICSSCGHEEHVFGADGGERLSEEYGVPVLSALPLSLSIREGADNGTPSVALDAHSDISATYISIARKLAAAVALSNGAVQVPEIVIE